LLPWAGGAATGAGAGAAGVGFGCLACTGFGLGAFRTCGCAGAAAAGARTGAAALGLPLFPRVVRGLVRTGFATGAGEGAADATDATAAVGAGLLARLRAGRRRACGFGAFLLEAFAARATGAGSGATSGGLKAAVTVRTGAEWIAGTRGRGAANGVGTGVTTL